MRRTVFHRAAARVRARPRLMLATILFFGLVAGLKLGHALQAQTVLLAFDISIATFLAMTAWMFSHSDETSMRQRASAEDSGGVSFLLSSVAVSTAVLVALAAELHAARRGDIAVIAIAASSLILSWLFINTMFAVHYAHRYYAGQLGKSGGLQFPGGNPPDYWDFAYFAFVLGMTFQVSDVPICDRHIRRIALLHGIVAFFFDVVIVSLSVNLIASQT